MRLRCASWLPLLVLIFSAADPEARKATAQSPGGTASEQDEELARQRQVIDRFVTVLERNPRRGTALDKIYGFHVENGTVEAFVVQLRDRVAAKADDGVGWMILGLVESQRGRDAAAVEALTKSKELRPTDPLAAYYLGQSLVLVGQPEKAAAEFEEAIQRKPAQADLLEIFQALGRVHQRAQRTAEALEVWSRLEKLFPGDVRVQEQIAVTLVEEGQSTEALPRYEKLAQATTDDYRRTVYRIEAAELKVKLNRAKDGIADLEQLLARLNPESWLFREVRRKIEEVFLRTDDQDGLANYYSAWLANNPEDIEAMSRLARVLARQARVPEATEWLNKALKLAPSRKELRLAFIEQLVDDQRYAESAQQYTELDKADPNNPDYLRDWGKLILRDSARPMEQRRTEAEKIWRRLLAARPDDPLTATQVADLFRNAEMQPQALALYQKAVELAPASPQYREYLGEYYHILQRSDEALATWRKMAEGDQRTATNVARLAEVLVQFGYLQQALPEIATACELDPKDFSLALKAADFEIRAEQYEAALAALARAENLTQNDEEREAVLSQQIKTFTLQQKLGDLAAELARQTASDGALQRQWYLLARYREALHEYPEATKAINESLKLAPNDIPSLASAARIAEQSGDLKTAADMNRKLAVVDRRGRTDYLQHVASLEAQLGRVDEALAAGRELIASAPGNVETYHFFADLCFRLGKTDDGLGALRRATRVNPNEQGLLLALAAALATQFRTDEAIELYWQALEKGKQIDDKLSVINKLTELYLQTNHFDQLLERLQRGRREADQRREMTICLAQAYQSAGDYGMARQELERLLSENTRDTTLLLQLSKLAESESDVASAVKYQEQLAKLAPAAESEYRLATLLSRAGDNQEAAAILVRLAAKEEDKEKLLRNIDSLLATQQEDTALALIEPKLRENPSDWEVLYRQGVALAKRTSTDGAAKAFQSILDLSLADDDLSTAARNRQKNPKARTFQPVGRIRPQNWRLDYTWQIRRTIGLEYQPYFSGPNQSSIWTPSDFGLARMAAAGWLYRFAELSNTADEFVSNQRARVDSSAATPRELWDWIYLQGVRQNHDGVFAAAKRLCERGGAPEKQLFLMKLATRNGDDSVYYGRPGGDDKEDKTPPLPPDELALALSTFDDIRRMAPDPNSDVNYYANAAAHTILLELKRAGRQEEEQKLYQEIIGRAASLEGLSAAMRLAVQRRDRATFLSLYERFAAKDLQATDSPSNANANWRQIVQQQIGQYIGQPDAAPDDIVETLDRFLNHHAAKTNRRRNSPTYRPSVRSPFSQQNNYTFVWRGGGQYHVPLAFPAPSDYFDREAIGIIRGAFEYFRGQDLTSDLVQHLQSMAANTPAADRLFFLLARAYVEVWNEDRESAAATFSEAAALAPQDLDLKLEVAQLHIEMKQLDEALALVDSITPLDQRTMQRREAMALDLAVRLGDHPRARDAAQRLFGLRLDAETQLTLAGQMRRLGMNEESEAVLARAQRQAGSRLSALAALMGQYQAQGNMELAAQVAHQILRRSRTAPAAQAAMGYYNQDSQSRTAALACLAQAGKMKELIASLEEQIKRAPQASQLFETLGEYYQAAGETQRMLELHAKIVSLRPDDAELRFRHAQELYRHGKPAEACDEYLIVLKKQPRIMANRYWDVIQAFQNARKETDLARTLSEINLKSLGQPYVVINLISNLMQNQRSRAAGMLLFKKAWEAFPEERSELMSNFDDAATWKLPEVIDYAKKSLLPTDEAVRNNPWYGLHGGISFEGDGRIKAALHRLLDAMAASNQLAKLRSELAAAVAEHPNWRGGPVLLAMIDLQQGKQLDVTSVIQPLIDAAGNDYELCYARWIVGQEIEKRPGQRRLAIKLLERASRPGDDMNDQFQFSPARALVELYKEDERRDEARKLLLKSARWEPQRDGNFWFQIGQKAQSLLEIGKLLEEIEQPVDALKVYRELLIKPEFRDPAIRNYTGQSPENFQNQARQAIAALIKRFGEQPTAEIAEALLTPPEKSSSKSAVIDLMIATAAVAGSPLPLLDSPFSSLIRPTGISAEGAGKIETMLVRLSDEHPRDLSVHVAAALFALKGNDAGKSRTALEKLGQLVTSTPLEELPAGKRANARQRADAAQHIGLWLVARESWNRQALRPLAEPLEKRAIAAAQRQLESAELTAILYERGRQALEDKDRAAAESSWRELIDLALVQPRLPRAGAAEGGQRAARIPATLSQFKLGAAIAQSAAEHGLTELSLQAIRETLSAGVPVADLPETGAAPVPGFRNPQGQIASRGDIDGTVFTELSSRMWQLSQLWKRHAFPPDQVCQLLEEMVFPSGRAGDVLIYEQPVKGDLRAARSLGRLLVEWAVRADRVGELEKQIAARQSSPTDIVSGQVLLVQLAALQGDEAKACENLQAIVKQLDGSKLASLSELAAHAAAVTLDDERLLTAAVPLLEKLVTAPSPEDHFPSNPEPHSAIAILTRHYLKTGDAATAASQVDRYLQSRHAFYSRFGGGDAALDFQRRDLAWGANELARGGDRATTLAALGRFADVTVRREASAAVDVALWHVSRQMRQLSPQERYERLRDWTMPDADRRSVRFVLGWDSGQPIPEVFFGPQPPLQATYDPQPRRAPLSNLTMLVEAAGQAGRLDELWSRVEPLAAEKTPGSETLAILTLLARRQPNAVAPRLEVIAKRVKESTPSANPQNRFDEERTSARWEDYLVARAALLSDELAAPARRLVQLLIVQARRTMQPDMVTRLLLDSAQSAAKGLSPGDRQQLAAPLKYWTTFQASSARDDGELPLAFCTVHEGHLVHRGNALYFKYPLAGHFEFSYDLYVSPDSLFEIGYDGLALFSAQPGSRVAISSAPQDQISRPPPLENRNGWNRVALRVTPARIQYFMNGHLVYQDRSPGQGSPWLVLGGSSAWPVMKNLRLTGAPSIPREVRLIGGERLDGWSGQFYSERLPPRLRKDALREPSVLEEPSFAAAGDEATNGTEDRPIDWRVENGVLEGRLDSMAGPHTPSLIEYPRPLADGERVAYQFLYEAAKTHVHPTLGRIAFLLEPMGVKLHWMTSESDEDDALLIDRRNVVDDPSVRRGPAALPLKEGEWNDVELAVANGVVMVRLNGELVCQRPVEPMSGHQFGLFHDKSQTAVKVRNVTLRGNWAESIAAKDGDLLALETSDVTPATARARHALVGEQYLTSDAYDFWKQSLDFDPQERYQFLKNWVLPNESHPTIRLQIDWTPTDPPPQSAAAMRSGGTPRSHRGGELVSPALELVNVAKELNKLDELAAVVALVAKEYPDQARALNSLEALLAITRGETRTAIDRLTKAVELVKEQPAETPLHERHGEYLATHAALSLSATRVAARALAQEITNDQRPPRAVDAEWSRRAPRLRGMALWATDPVTRDLPFGGGFTLQQWLPVTRITAKDRGEGFGAAAWKITPGEATYMTGMGHDAIYFTAPLAGEFEVHGQISTAGNKIVRLVYGAVALNLTADGTTLVRQEIGRTGVIRTPILEKINGWGPTVDFRLAIKKGSLALSINDQQVHTELLSRDADPWLAIESGSGNQTGMVRNLQIRGAPTVPREIPLSQGPGLEGWSADYYGELTGHDRNREGQPRQKAAWVKKSDEITAGKFPNSVSSFRESVLQYHRPLAEDGEIEYEFFYEPRKTDVHPAIDRVVFLLGTKETKLHWLTDAQYDRSGLAPDNSEPLAGAKRAPLKAGDWNKVRLVLAGDEVTLFVNGEAIGGRTLEPTNQRLFGFFRYSDATAVRIRNVVHRGNWPMVVPPVEQQELASAPPPAPSAAKGKAKAKAKSN